MAIPEKNPKERGGNETCPWIKRSIETNVDWDKS